MVNKRAITTDINYINRNNQKNLGCLNVPGTDNNSLLYQMQCQLCKHSYESNGTDIFERKCPNCQNGKK